MEVCRFAVDAVPIGLQDLKYITACCYLGENAYKFLNDLWRRLCSMHKVGGAQPPEFQVGGSSPRSPLAPTSLHKTWSSTKNE